MEKTYRSMPHLSKKRWKSITSLSAKIKLVMIDVVQRSYPVSFGFFYQLLFLTLIPSQLITPMLPSNNLSKILYKNSCCSLFFFLFFRVLLTFDWMIGFKSWTQKRDNYCVIYIYIYLPHNLTTLSIINPYRTKYIQSSFFPRIITWCWNLSPHLH